MQPGRIQNPKDRNVYGPLQDGYEKGIIHADDSTHARLRRIYGPAFSPKAVEEQAGMLMKYADLLVAQLKIAIRKEQVQDISAWYNFTTFDLTGDFAFGEAFHCLDRGGAYHFFISTLFSGMKMSVQMQQVERYGLFTLLKPLIPKSMMKPKEDMDRYTRELVDRRVERGYVQGKMDVFNYLLLNKDPEDQLTAPELYENGLTLVLAGSETTASLLTGITYFLCTNPDALRKVQSEVRSAFTKDEDITQRSVNGLSYMLAVLNEGMRVFPPAAIGFPRIITRKGGQDVAGNWIPEKVPCSYQFHLTIRFDLI